jgi:hypothetical protein
MGMHAHISVLSNSLTCFEMGFQLRRLKGCEYCWSLSLCLRLETHSLIGPLLHARAGWRMKRPGLEANQEYVDLCIHSPSSWRNAELLENKENLIFLF